MAPKQRRAQKPVTPAQGEHPQLDRRNFLKLTALSGAGALATPALAACAAPPVAPAGTPAPAKPVGGNGNGQGNSTASTLPAINPATDGLETWSEPWVWRPAEWPGQQLDLNVVENENPVAAVGFGNPSAILFNYGGITPGPTIRMGGSETLSVRVRNLLGEDDGMTPVGQAPDPAELTPEMDKQICTLAGVAEDCRAQDYPQFVYDVVPADVRQDWCLGEHTNGVHSARVTNLHTHGLHVRPGKNPDGTHSDNVLLRVMSQADFRRREHAEDPSCRFESRYGRSSRLQ